MSAYVVVEIEVTDPIEYEEYKRLAAPTVTAYGGRYLVRGGAVTTLEGEWCPQRLVVLEFESASRAKEWLQSPEYGLPRAIRHSTARTQMILVEGV